MGQVKPIGSGRGDSAVVSPRGPAVLYHGRMQKTSQHPSETLSRCGWIARTAMVAILVSALSLPFGFGGSIAPIRVDSAFADEAEDAQKTVDEAQSTLDVAESSMASLAAEYDGLSQQIDALQQQIDETAAQAMESQQAMIEGRQALGKAAAYEYRSGSASSLLTLLLESNDFDELVRNVAYLQTIMQYRSDEVAAQKERIAHFNELVDSLNFQRDEQGKKLSELEKKKEEASQIVSGASSKLQNAQDDQATRLAELQRKAEEMAAQGDVGEPVVVEDANTVDRSDVVPENTPVAPNPQPTVPDTGGGSGGSETGWSTGVASAYGGSTDPGTPNPGTTATGALCDDNSMGVAVPMAWPNYWQYYGRTVEISYGGMTVFATVNDCGGMGGGSRSLDLQPGVWKAFGFSSCLDWGLRTVNYRFL